MRRVRRVVSQTVPLVRGRSLRWWKRRGGMVRFFSGRDKRKDFRACSVWEEWEASFLLVLMDSMDLGVFR